MRSRRFSCMSEKGWNKYIKVVENINYWIERRNRKYVKKRDDR